MLQQYLPLAVLKHKIKNKYKYYITSQLQQYLLLAVLELNTFFEIANGSSASCNSTYRLRY